MHDATQEKTERKNGFIFFFLIGSVLLLSAFTFLKDSSLFSKTLFEREQAAYKPYFRDDFEGYEKYSEVLDHAPEDLSRWHSTGAITAWLDVADWKTIDQVDLTLTDAAGKSATFSGLPNMKLPREDNQIESDDAFPDFTFHCDQPVKKWEDFMIVNGRNLLFWEYDKGPKIDMAHIVSWKATDKGVELPVTDVVVQDGLCDARNSLAGKWRTPNGLPQYGVWWPQDGKLVMKNVEQEQYPSNGDHVRILSRETTPRNFLLRTKFTVTRVDEENPENTFFRLAWDFDDVFDPGHDETVVYDTFKYGYLGLQRVYPIDRSYTQGFEPESGEKEGKTRFAYKEGHTYELDVKVEGQTATAETYEIDGTSSRRVAQTSYTFMKPRPELSYPFAVETTGNVNIVLDDFEVLSK